MMMMTSRKGLLLALCAILLCSCAHALMHEDEVGHRDWYYQGLGKIGLASFVVSPSSKQLVVASAAASVGASKHPLIASVAHSGGEIRWRHLLDSHPVCLSTSDAGVLYVTERGTGALLATSTGNVQYSFALTLPADATVRDCVLRTVPNGGRAPQLLAAATSGLNVYLFESSFASAEEEGVTFTRTFTLKNEVVTSAKFAGSRHLWVEHNLTAVDVIELESGELSFTDVQGKLEGTAPTGEALFSFVKEEDMGKCDAVRGKMARLMSAEKKVVKATEGKGRTASCKECYLGIATTSNQEAGDLVAVVRAEDGQSLDFYHMTHAKHTLNYPTQFPPRVLAVRSTDKKAEVLVRFTSHHLALVSIHNENGVTVLWERFEGLSSPALARVVPLPRLQNAAASSETSVRDELFGFQTYAIVVSTTGVIYRLPAQKPRNEAPQITVVRNVAKDAFDSLGGCPCSIEYVDLLINDNGVAAIAARNKKGSVTLLVDVVTGELLETKRYVTVVPAFTSATTMVDGTSLEVERLRGAARSEPQYLFRAATGSHEVQGLLIPAGSTKAQSTWTVRTRGPILATASSASDPLAVLTVENLRMFPNITFKKDKITEVRRRYPTDNIVVVAHVETEANTQQSSDEDDDAADSRTSSSTWQTLVVTVIDTITGSVLARASHPSASSRVHLLIVEHVVLYHFLNVEKMRYAVGVIELLLPESELVLESTGTSPARIIASLFAKQQTFSSFSAQPPIAANQVLSFPAGSVEAMGVTTSYQGVSRKQVLFALTNGGVLAVDLRALCFGGQTNPQKPEEVLTHVAAATENILSHRHTVAGAKLITTTPTELESSTHMVVAGLDLFYARVSSGKAFDLLNDDFNHEMLLIMCGVLLVVALVLRTAVERQTLRELWA